jgi:hypothetical protein
MFNPFDIRVRPKEPAVGFIERFKLGGLALDVARWVGNLVRQIEPAAVLSIIVKVLDIERNSRGIPGAQKLEQLLSWLREQHPGLGMGEHNVAGFVSALVSLLNAIAIFRK